MTIRRITVASLAFSAILGLGAVAPAQAGGFLSSEPYDFTDSDTFNDCGTTIGYEGHFWGHTTIRDANRSTGGQFFYFRDYSNASETFTDLSTGDFITATASVTFRELQPRVISDDGRIIEWITKASGVHWELRDSDGNLLLRDRGTITERYSFDSLGDGQPGGGDFEWLGVVKKAGQFPSDNVDLCSYVG